MLSVLLLFTDSHYPFGIFKLFLHEIFLSYAYDMAITFLFGFHKTVQVMCNIRHLLKFV